ncbi:hypothetical protein BGW36DRAFT_79903 [Talaromyces proteolyticus]|uniref:Uncharacterized protein n=1 Tax=Talaromyces proteolyticus TaxID=1131652 RepID=A0AAD4KHU6_9EURO|nr:uncharacterized protein BGW36DRAFT_79903 [Talaromyces proteolyticus]KAH8688792.1 hypothetical protein BGW36DRAFT_79903 [Talaromyces proteolyticus]
MSISASAIIVIAICASGVVVTIMFVFARYFGANFLEINIAGRSQEQDLYMRQVRQRSQAYAYAEALKATGGVSTTRTSQVWSTPDTPGAGAGGSWGQGRSNQQQQGQGQGYPGNGSSNYVNYSSLNEGQYYEQSPYEPGNDNSYFAHNQQQNTPIQLVSPVNAESSTR